MQRISLGNALKDQKGITGLETAIVLIAFVVVAAVFAFTVITTGLFSSEKAAETATAGLGEASTSLTPKGSALASGNHGNDSVSIVWFKLANSGAQAVGLPAARTLVTYSDTSNLVTLERAAAHGSRRWSRPYRRFLQPRVSPQTCSQITFRMSSKRR